MNTHIVTLPKSTVPYIGIPVPGERPFIVSREKFEGTIKGINITDWSIQRMTDGGRILVLTHVTGRVRGRSRFYDAGHGWAVIRAIREWSMREQKKREKPKLTTHDRKITSLQKQIGKIGAISPPVHPLVKIVYKGEEYQDYVRRHLADWYSQKKQRKALARIAGRFLKFKVTDITAYKQVREAGFKLQFTYSQRRANRESWSTSDYWRNIYAVVGLNDGGDTWYLKPEQFDLVAIKQARDRYLTAKREKFMLEEQIKAIQVKQNPEPQAYAAD